MRWSAYGALFSILSLALAWETACPTGVRAASFVDDPPSEVAALLAIKAKRAEKTGDLAQAFVYYSQASALQPHNRGYRNQASALQYAGPRKSNRPWRRLNRLLPGHPRPIRRGRRF